MLFEACGNLREDYGASCEVLRLTEREDIYSAIITNDGSRLPLLAQQGKTDDTGQLITTVLEGSGAKTSMVNLEAAAPELSKCTGRNSASTGGERGSPKLKSRVQSLTKRWKSATVGKTSTCISVTPCEPSVSLPSNPDPPLTMVHLSHSKFCINQRDMTPLTRAMPHCASLVSIKMLGCGLSVESYMLLVEAIFKCYRVIDVAIDFNCIPHPGFVTDPTLSSSQLPNVLQVGTETEAKSGATLTSLPLPTGVDAEQPVGGLAAKEAAPQAVAASGANAGAGDMFLYPAELCGLHLLPSPLEQQLLEEKERKGKVDQKKLLLLQAQQEQLRLFNETNRIKLPRSWEGMLLTGVKYLSLRGNGIDDGAVGRILNTILRNPYTQLLSLNLWGNCITDTGAGYVAEFLRRNRVLRVLDLGHNNIGDLGLLKIIDCFRMMELVGADAIHSYRQMVLTRPGASAEERAAAQQTVPLSAYPTYQDLYNHWYVHHASPANDDKTTLAWGSLGINRRGATGLGGGTRGAGSKGAAAAATKHELPATLHRPTTPFDRLCIRVPVVAEGGSPSSAVAVRMPGNTVLEVLNLAENTGVTLVGVTEACRRLALRAPETDEEMQAMAIAREPSSAAGVEMEAAAVLKNAHGAGRAFTNNAASNILHLKHGGSHCAGGANAIPVAVQPPELHCAGLRLRVCEFCSFSFKEHKLWPEMRALQQRKREVLRQIAADAAADAPACAVAENITVETATAAA